jgi:glutaredoxin
MKTIDIYYSSVCGLCTKAIEYFHSRGVTFTAYAIEYDATADAFVDSENTRTMYKRCGEEVEFVPQIFIGGQYIGGWRKLEPLIESGKIDTLI